MSCNQTLLGSEASSKPLLECHQWMSDLWDNLEAECKAHDGHVNALQREILRKHLDRIDTKLQERLCEKQCSLIRTIKNRPGLHRHHTSYLNDAITVKTNALDTIVEADPETPRVSKKQKIRSWIKKTLKRYEKCCGNDSV